MARGSGVVAGARWTLGARCVLWCSLSCVLSWRQRFWTEVHDGTKLFYLSGLEKSGRYPKTEVHNLARFISVAKFRPLIWRNTHPYVPVLPPCAPLSAVFVPSCPCCAGHT